jgi:cell wall-associated NlpC family hydrolase
MTRGHELAKAAASFLGVRFLLHGRDPRYGLDCVGLVAASLKSVGVQSHEPSGYGLRNSSIAQWLPSANKSGLTQVRSEVVAGDILLLQPGPAQHHLLIAEGTTSVIHAHAGLRRVVRQPLSENLVASAIWRLAD